MKTLKKLLPILLFLLVITSCSKDDNTYMNEQVLKTDRNNNLLKITSTNAFNINEVQKQNIIYTYNSYVKSIHTINSSDEEANFLDCLGAAFYAYIETQLRCKEGTGEYWPHSLSDEECKKDAISNARGAFFHCYFGMEDLSDEEFLNLLGLLSYNINTNN